MTNQNTSMDKQDSQDAVYSKEATPAASLWNRPMFLGVFVFVTVATFFSLLIYQRYQLAREQKIKAAIEAVNSVKDNIQETLAHSASAAKSLSFYIDKDGNVNNFDSVAAQVMYAITDIDALQLVPDGVIRYVYPLKANESVIGYDILNDKNRRDEAYEAIRRKEMFFAGPFELKQGGMGVVGRLPVYRNGKFWGFSAVVIRLSTLLKAASIDGAGKNGYIFQLSKLNPSTGREEFFLPKHDEQESSLAVSVELPNGEWKLSVRDTNSFPGFIDILLLGVLGLLFSVFASITVYRFAIRPKKLDELVKKRTAELAISQKKYQSVIERVSDAFVAIDSNWVYTYVNKKAGEIFNREPASLIGKHIWREFPEAIDQPFYHAYHKAMQTQQYQYLEEFYPPWEKWFENHIYPSADGLTIFFKDVTKIKKISLALEVNEEKYRSLIEQASDGIVITNLEGNILEVNNSIKKMLSYDEPDMIGANITRFVPEEDKEETPLRIHELLQGKNLLYERRLIKKDGTYIDVEINSKMASSQTLIGFVRDISLRKKSQQELQISQQRFELIANATHDAVWDHDFFKDETWGNTKLYDLYGVDGSKEKINFQMFMDRIHPEERNGIEKRLQKAIFNRETNINEIFRFSTPSEGYRIFIDRAHIKYNDNGEPVRILGAMQDITESEEAKRQIIQNEEKFRAIIEQASEGIFVSDENTTFLTVNSAGCKMLGYTLEELQKMNFYNLVLPKDLETNPIRIMQMNRGDFVINERRLLRKDGSMIDVEISTKKMLDGRYQSVARDITERKKAEEKILESERKYKLLFYYNPLPMWMTSLPELDIIDVNESAIQHYGYSREEFSKLNAIDLRPAEDIELFVQEIRNMQPNVKHTGERRHKKKDGTIINVEIHSYEIEYEGRRALLNLSNDVTEKEKAKDLLEKSYEEIRQLAGNLQTIREEERTSISREIHDELGQQLTGLKMDIHWLSRKIKGADEEVTKKMNESIDLINSTITSVRKISTNLRPSILDDLGLLAALEWQGEEFEKRSGTTVYFKNAAGDLPVKPEVATGVFRIYQELLTNIARHANASKVKAELSREGNWLYFSVSDNGVGFNPNGIRNKKTLGLLGIKERTLLFGGNCEFKSQPGRGTITTISIPFDNN